MVSKEASLYFHIPFCSRKCPYCHFYVLPDKDPFKQQLVKALFLEWQGLIPKLANRAIVSLYFGGGTPSLIGPEAIGRMIDWVNSSGLAIDPACEVTLEANPDKVTLDLMRAYREAGVNRLSFGVQSFDDHLLTVLGREHDAQAAKEAVLMAAAAGIENISIDLMYDLPEQKLESWQRSLKELKTLPIAHLSLYNLTIEPETLFFKQKAQLTPLLPSPQASLKMLQTAVAELEEIGLRRYEISAFAKPGFEARHNSGYWTGRPFFGLGPSAFSYWEGKRFRNVAHLGRYAAALKEGRSPVDFEESLPYPSNLKELLAVQLRLVAGVELDHFQKRYGVLPDETTATLASLQTKGWIQHNGTHVRLTEEGRLFYDSVAETII